MAAARTIRRFAATERHGQNVMHDEKSDVDLSIILPTYNERENLGELFAEVDRALDGSCFEVIVVDDDSPDGTYVVAQEFEERYPWLRVIRRQNVRGLASAVICGFRRGRGNILAVMDADLQHDVSLLPGLLEEMKHADFAVGTRRAAGGSDGKWSQLRRFGSFVATALARWMTNTPFSDPMSGFFALRREVFEMIDGVDLYPRGYKILVYLYAKASQKIGPKALRLAEVGYEFSRRAHGRSKVSLKVVIDYLLMLIELRFDTEVGVTRPQWSHALF